MSRKKTYDEFINEYFLKHKDSNYIFIKETFVDSHTPMKIICPKHGEFWQSPKNIMQYDCRKCSYEKRGEKNKLSTDDFIKKARLIHGDKYDYSKAKYQTAKTPILIICPKHGEFWQTPNDHLSKKGCPFCNESHLEKEFKRELDNNHINYIQQYKINELGKQSIDFYLTDFNIAIECQGKQHFGIGGWTSCYDFERQKYLDETKYNILKEKGIKTVYITQKNFLKYENYSDIYKNNIFTIKQFLECIIPKK